MPSELPRLVEGLRLLNRADPFLEVTLQDKGEYVLGAAGMRCCIQLSKWMLCSAADAQVSSAAVMYRHCDSKVLLCLSQTARHQMKGWQHKSGMTEIMAFMHTGNMPKTPQISKLVSQCCLVVANRAAPLCSTSIGIVGECVPSWTARRGGSLGDCNQGPEGALCSHPAADFCPACCLQRVRLPAIRGA